MNENNPAPQKRKSLIELALKYKQIPITICLLLCIIGLYSLLYMPRQEFPEFKVRQGLVIGAFPGASAKQVDEQLAKPLENYLFHFKEVDRSQTYSVSKEGQTIVFVEVKPDVKEPDLFWAKLRLGLQELKSSLPPQVVMLVGDNEFGDASAVLLSVTSKKRSYRELENYLEKLEDEIRANPAVSKVKHYGLQKEQITVYADPARLAQFGVKPALLTAALQLEGVLGYGGYVKDTDLEYPIHLPARYNSVADVAEQIVMIKPDGGVVRVRDVARVVKEYDVEDSFIESDGQRALVLSMEMRFGNNIVSFGKKVDKMIAQFKTECPPDIEVTKVADMPQVVKYSINHFMVEFGMAILSVIIVVMLLLPRRIAVVAAVTIPICILQSLGILQALGVELNTVSLAVLVVVLGMVVDNAIVVIDNYVEQLDLGMDRYTAAWASAKELFVPVFTATLAIVLAFAPYPIFMTTSGIMGDFVKPMPTTVAVTLFASMFIAMYLVPIFDYMFIKQGLHGAAKRKNGHTLLEILQTFYNKKLSDAMKKPRLSVSVGIIAIVLGVVMLSFLSVQLIPKLDRNQFAVEIYFPEGTSLAANTQVTHQVVSLLQKDKRVQNVIAFIGTSSPRFHTLYAPQIPAKNYSQLIVITDTQKHTEDVLKEYGPKYSNAFPLAYVRFKQLDFLNTEAPVEIRVIGEDSAKVNEIVQKIEKNMSSDKDITWLRDDTRGSRISADLDINKEAAARLGLSRAMIGLNMALNRQGIPVATVWDGDYGKSVVLKYDGGKTSSPTDLLNQYINAPLAPKGVLLRQVADVMPGFGPGQVIRRNGVPTVTVRADIGFGKLAQPVLDRAQKFIKTLNIPAGVSIDYGGEYHESFKTYIPMAQSLIASIFLIFIVLLFQFQSVKIAFLVMLTMPFGIIGGAIGMLLMRYPFGMTTVLGFVALFGTVIRNGVILISYARELEAKGMPLKKAAFAAGKRRMRPIFLTASAAAVGVIPLMLSGSKLWGPMGAVICFGLISSTVLTLYVLPVAYWKYSGDKGDPEERKD